MCKWEIVILPQFSVTEEEQLHAGVAGGGVAGGEGGGGEAGGGGGGGAGGTVPHEQHN